MIPFIIRPDEQYSQYLTRLEDKLERFKTVSEHLDPDPDDDRWTNNRIDNLLATMQLEGHMLWRDQIANIIEENFPEWKDHSLTLACKVAELYEDCSDLHPGAPDAEFQILRRLGNTMDNPDRLYREHKSLNHINKQYIPEGVEAGKIPELMGQVYELLVSPHFKPAEKAFLVHFGLQAIQPFEENNGIIGRCWQTMLLEEEYPLIRFARIDALTYKYRGEYRECLFKSVQAKDPVEFLRFMLKITDAAVKEFVVPKRAMKSALERIRYVHKHDLHEFSRKDYMNILEHISAPTASRDLATGVRLGFFERKGTKRLTLYSCLEKDQSRKESQRIYDQNCKDR